MWRVENAGSAYSDATIHRPSNRRGGLIVGFHPHDNRYSVSLSDGHLSHALVSEDGWTRLTKRSGPLLTLDGEEEAAPPSETLKQLIKQHRQHPDQWPILLDAIQEEYPQLHEAIEAHHAARRSDDSATAQYARAVSATLSATR